MTLLILMGKVELEFSWFLLRSIPSLCSLLGVSFFSAFLNFYVDFVLSFANTNCQFKPNLDRSSS